MSRRRSLTSTKQAGQIPMTPGLLAEFPGWQVTVASSHGLRKGTETKSTLSASRKIFSSPLRKAEFHVLEQLQWRVSFQVNLSAVFFLNRFFGKLWRFLVGRVLFLLTCYRAACWIKNDSDIFAKFYSFFHMCQYRSLTYRKESCIALKRGAVLQPAPPSLPHHISPA